jgi:hypothetical protein
MSSVAMMQIVSSFMSCILKRTASNREINTSLLHRTAIQFRTKRDCKSENQRPNPYDRYNQGLLVGW